MDAVSIGGTSERDVTAQTLFGTIAQLGIAVAPECFESTAYTAKAH